MTTTATPARPRPTPSTPRAAVLSLARLEAGRMIRNPALPIGLALTIYVAAGSFDLDWSGAAYGHIPTSFGALLFGISLASAVAAGRDHHMLAEEAPLDVPHRSGARLIAGLVPVALMAIVVLAGTMWLVARGGLDLGDEPGRTLHAYYTLPELFQPVVLAFLAVAVGAAAGRALRSRFVAAIVLFIGWYLVSAAYWVFHTPQVVAFSIIQSQPFTVPVGTRTTDPSTFPADWLLSAPAEPGDYWARIVVSPSMAVWHNVYLIGLTLLAAAVALPGRWRRALIITGALVAIVGVVLQKLVQP